MAKKPVQKPKIKIMAADWSLRDYPSARNPWTIQTKVRKVKEAGFHGMPQNYTNRDWKWSVG